MGRMLSVPLVALWLNVAVYGFFTYTTPTLTYNYLKLIGVPAAARRKQFEDEIQSGVGGRIVGGAPAPPNAYPYLGGLLVTLANGAGSALCGSSLISDSRLVTAAHCWNDGYSGAEQVEVVLGSQYVFYGGTRITSNDVITHPYWNPSTTGNDVAIIYLPVSVPISDSIYPINLPQYNVWDDFVGQWVKAAGYGGTSDYSSILPDTTIINHIDLQVIPIQDCQSVFGFTVTENNICTSGAGGIGICGGDSGGPLVAYNNGEETLIGIASFISAAGCESGFPSVFTRVTRFLDFIMQ